MTAPKRDAGALSKRRNQIKMEQKSTFRETFKLGGFREFPYLLSTINVLERALFKGNP